MLLHLNRLYALMLILSLVHCGPENGIHLRDLQVDVTDGNQDVKQSHIGNENSKVGAVGDNRADTLINFKMHQMRYPKVLDRKKRLINMTPILNPSGRTYLGNLAAATNDAYLKMQNYAATFLVVVTTPRSGQKVELPPPTNPYATMNPVNTVKKKARGYPGRYRDHHDNNIVHEHRYRSVNTFKPKQRTTIPTQTTEKMDIDDPLMMADSFGSRVKRSAKQGKHRVKTEESEQTSTRPTRAPSTTTTVKYPEVNIIDNMDQLLRVVHVKENKDHEQNLADITFPTTTTTTSKPQTRVTTKSPNSTVSKKSTNKSEPTKLVNTTQAEAEAEAKLVPKKPNPYTWENQLMHEVKIKVREGKNCTGEACDKMHMNEDTVISDPLAGDCNVEKEDDGKDKGGYDIPNKDDLAEQKTNDKCPPKVEDECSSDLHETTTQASNGSNEGCTDEPEPKNKGKPKPPKCGEKPDFKNMDDKTTTKKTFEKTCESNDDDDVETECGDGESDSKLPHQQKCSDSKEDKKVKKVQPKPRVRRQISGLLSDTLSSTPHYTIFKLANLNLSNSQLLSPAQLIPAHIDIPRSLDNNTSMHTLTGTTVASNIITQSLPEHMIKKSIDKNALPVLIENLKVVDQKLAEAVEPLHCAQETLDNLSKAECTTPPPACNSGTTDNVLSDISDAERSALQKLAYKIINCGGGKLKRSNIKPTPATTTDFLDRDGIIAKRGISPSTDGNPEANVGTVRALDEIKKVSVRSPGVDTTMSADKTTIRPTELSSTDKMIVRSPSIDSTDKVSVRSTSDTDKTSSQLPATVSTSSPPPSKNLGSQDHVLKAKMAEDYDYENVETKEERLNRLQRDLNVANELQQIIDEIQHDKPRNKRHAPNHHNIEEHLYDTRRNNEERVHEKTNQSHKSNHNKEGDNSDNSLHKKEGENDDLMEDNRSLLRPKLKKKKKKTFWRKLFGKRAVDDRFLNRIPNFQLSARTEGAGDPSITTLGA